MSIKQQITQHLLQQLPDSDRPSFDQALQTWWNNFHHSTGLRLTYEGYQAMLDCEFECYRFDVAADVFAMARNLLILDRKLHCPYYLKLDKKPQIVMFGSSAAMMLAMYGDFDQWLKFLLRQ